MRKTTASLEAAETAQKRAQTEQFSFQIEAPGMVEVTNESHDNPTEHRYFVTLDDVTGDAMACTCPHHVHRSAFCKHMTGVEDAAADGDLDVFPSEDNDESDDVEAPSDDENKPPEDYDCDGLGGFPCWPCVRTGRKELPN
ncbi:SWIM zinc finger family protein [Haladaptatus sp. DYF46]|uniref:SWIM zinc finger family protein n=1 Tax=Haladaptatus sp. DYF46 TaxID=2886041 RepID=UPI001E489AE3|nr:SWIM zinc finger family protein [Haladaptatus sp. DYF46]